MNAYAISLSKYVNTGIIALFTLLSYLGFSVQGRKLGRAVEIIQRILLAAFLINSNLTIASFVSGSTGRKLTMLCAMEILFLLSFMVLYRIVHEMANMFLFNNICMLLSIGFVMITRIAFYGSSEETAYMANQPLKQFVMASAGLMFMLIIPFFRRIFDSMRHMGIIFAVLGIAALTIVLLISPETYGAMITFTIAGFTFQPSEFVKILYILMLAALLSGEVTVSRALLVSVLSFAHVGILVLSRDLGSALIFFIVYLMMLFLATGRWSILAAGCTLGAVGAFIGYSLFYHVQVRVAVWQDPFSVIDGMGYQITQALFAISYGGLWGAGLTQGVPTDIPQVQTDFMFAAIAEEMGMIFGICLLLLCLNCFIRILLLSASYSNRFFQLFTYGAAVCYIFQIFLTVGGETKFIPLTGVTLPLVSYGGSSILSTLIMLGIVEMIFIMHEERTAGFMERYEQEKLQAAGGMGPVPPGIENPGNSGAFPYPGGFGQGPVPEGGPDGSSFHGSFQNNNQGVFQNNNQGVFQNNDPGGYQNGAVGNQGIYPGYSSGQTDFGAGSRDNFPVNGVSEEGIFDDFPYENRPDSGSQNYGFYHPGEIKK